MTLADLAHIIGVGKSSPRSEHHLAEIIQKDGLSNLIILCLDCHRVVDELEAKYSVEQMRMWKEHHIRKIQSVFSVPIFHDEQELLKEVSDLLDQNRRIFEAYGPFSKQALEGQSGDTHKIWRRRCLDTILPNNQKIIDIFEKNKKNFPYPWDAYREMLDYKIHADSFRENCLFTERINDYKLFPVAFDHFVKSKLGIGLESLETRRKEVIEFRSNTISEYINRFLANHSFIRHMEQWNECIFEAHLVDDRVLRVFVTNAYYFTAYTFESITIIDPNIDAIICSNPYSSYSEDAKRLCIQHNVGLFMLKEFMGAVRVQGEDFLNYLLNEEKRARIQYLADNLRKSKLLPGKCRVYVLGSYLRRKVFEDIDIIVAYKHGMSTRGIDALVDEIRSIFKESGNRLDITVCSEREFSRLTLDHDNTESLL
ncbi:MAG: nucleotidyltransferase domain-containing protein [Thermodesulfobacteriota bacterium]